MIKILAIFACFYFLISNIGETQARGLAGQQSVQETTTTIAVDDEDDDEDDEDDDEDEEDDEE